jgi:hypothetical protein
MTYPVVQGKVDGKTLVGASMYQPGGPSIHLFDDGTFEVVYTLWGTSPDIFAQLPAIGAACPTADQGGYDFSSLDLRDINIQPWDGDTPNKVRILLTYRDPQNSRDAASMTVGDDYAEASGAIEMVPIRDKRSPYASYSDEALAVLEAAGIETVAVPTAVYTYVDYIAAPSWTQSMAIVDSVGNVIGDVIDDVPGMTLAGTQQWRLDDVQIRRVARDLYERRCSYRYSSVAWDSFATTTTSTSTTTTTTTTAA